MSLTSLLIPTYRQMLQSLSAWLEKAQAQLAGDDADALLSARLAPDMFPLATQIRFACVQAWEGVHRLQDQPLPPLVQTLIDEGRQAGENPGSIASARARIGDTIAMLDGLAQDALDREAQQPLAHELPNGMIFDLTAESYARDWTLPQFYFHVMTAYTILRKEGIALGKADYVAHMLPHLRPGTVPVA
ncbi:DUF1993 domain-containing protein [Sphingobium lactosutens]|uniref:DUF1993 domain-containing protein n=1 Tax=Sphingobium lactosutens TaxID=522773 RepID=UPI0015BC74BE|nr:DUF1993 domain-containing protein [Sphingobium lactosutens]NWK94941.1 DUF1993 domain-containing protein [Sphingobium lactosutens]